MPYPQPNYARDDIADALLQQQNQGGALGAGLTGLSGAMPANMPTAMPAGMPQTPGGGVPGSGMAPAAPSFVPAPPRPQGMGTTIPPLTGAYIDAPIGLPMDPRGRGMNAPPGVARKQRML